jgi:hypothetical protein
VASWLDDLNFGYFTKDQVKVWLNNAYDEGMKKLINEGQNFYINCVETKTVVNQTIYVLPDDFRKINRFEIVTSGLGTDTESSGPIIPLTLGQKDLIAAVAGVPNAYTFVGKNRIRIFPRPDSQTYVMRLYYTFRPPKMVNDNDEPVFPREYREYIALLAARDGFLKDGRIPDLINDKIAKYETWMQRDFQERNQDFPRSVVYTEEQFTQGYHW